MNPVQDIVKQINFWRGNRSRLLILTHERPDGDALGAQAGLHRLLVENGHKCTSYLSQPYPARYQLLFADIVKDLDFRWETAPEPIDFDGVFILDTANATRVDFPNKKTLKAGANRICVIDHHYDNGRFGDVNWIDANYAATAQMIAEFAKISNLKMNKPAANALLAGIITDCGGFRFRNTNASVFRTAAELTEQGADPGTLADSLFFNEPYAKMRLKARVLESAKFEFDRKFVYAVITPELLHELNLTPDHTEDVIDVIRAVAGTKIVCLFQYTPEGDTRISLRSRSDEIDVSAIAHQLGGGGHKLAAGARIKQTPAAQAVNQVRKLVGATLAK